ncbi:MAG: hypothetical protein H6810_10625 [Phycisphaeraceae bacterium]|nr:MAG: hypothetical protein H6810_10625 [Phycisphaeraceae bacterium]
MMCLNRATIVVALAGLAAGATAQTDIFWNAGSAGWNNAANWSPMNVPDATDENALILGPSGITVTLDLTPFINSLSIGAGVTLACEAARSLVLTGDLDNDGLILVNPSNSSADATMQFNADAAISGTGTLRLAGGGNDAGLYTSGATLTNSFGHTIDGAGLIGAALVNEGVVSSLDAGFGTELELNGSPKTNNSTMSAAAGSSLRFTGVVISQGPGGTIGADMGGLVIFNGNVTVTGGAIGGQETVERLAGGTLTLSDVALAQDVNVAATGSVFYNGALLDCSGVIILNDSTSANDAVLQFNTDTTATGGGEVFLAGSGNDSQVLTNATTLTIAPDFSLGGSGEVHAALVNNGLVRAYPSANGNGRLRLLTENKTNNATMRAEVGGALEVSGITLTQGAGGEILADGGSVEFVGNQAVSGGTIRSANGGVVTRVDTGTLTLTGVDIETDLGVVATGTVLYNGPTMNCTGAIVLNDTTSANDALLRFDTDTIASGGGSIFLGGSNNDSQVQTNGTILTVASDFTIEGSGEVHAALVNNGLLRGFPSAFGDGDLDLITQNKTNNAIIRADAGGRVRISGITLSQGPAGELLADGGDIRFDGNQTLVGGKIRSVNGGTVTRSGNGTLTMSDVEVQGDLNLVPPSTLVHTGDALVCSASIILNDTSSSNDSILQFDADSTVSGGGSIFLGGSNNDSQVQTNGTVLTVASDFTIEGSGEIHADLVNNGLIRAFPSPNGNGTLTLTTGDKANNGQMLASAGGTLVIAAITVDQAGEGGTPGEIVADEGTVLFTGNQAIHGGVLRGANGGRLVRNGNGTLTASDVTLDGDLELVPPSTLLCDSATLVNNGVVIINDTGSSNDSIVQFDAPTVVSGSGRFVLAGGPGDSRIVANAVTPTFGANQRIEGLGDLHGSFVLDGVIAPGLPYGSITGSANLDFGPSARFETEVAGVSTHGSLVTSGMVEPNGLVVIQLRDGYTPLVNDQYNMVTAGSINGLFADAVVAVGLLPANLDVRLVYTPTTVDVKFVCISDLAPPYGVLDLADVNGFVSAFISQDPLADIAEPIGVFDLLDISTFIVNFLNGCN